MLQLKEAAGSALAPFTGQEPLPQRGAARGGGSAAAPGRELGRLLGLDRFRGARIWTGLQHDFYVRQLWDWKISADVEKQRPGDDVHLRADLRLDAGARAHARSGDRCAIAAYLGQGGDVFDLAVGASPVPYAEQNEADYAALAGRGQVGPYRG